MCFKCNFCSNLLDECFSSIQFSVSLCTNILKRLNRTDTSSTVVISKESVKMPKLTSFTTSQTNTIYLRTPCCGRIKNSDCPPFTLLSQPTLSVGTRRQKSRVYGANRSKTGKKRHQNQLLFKPLFKRQKKRSEGRLHIPANSLAF